MDFNYSEEQEAVRQLAGQIFSERSTHDRLKEIEAAAGDDGPFDRELWKELADAGLLGIHLREDVGGAGSRLRGGLPGGGGGRPHGGLRPGGRDDGLRRAAHRPLRHRRAAQDLAHRRGQRRDVLTAAMAELVGEVILPGGTEPATTATAQADGSWVLSGTKACVPAAFVADAILVPATCQTADGAAHRSPASSSWSGAPTASP